jgi:hypothetical protein
MQPPMVANDAIQQWGRTGVESVLRLHNSFWQGSRSLRIFNCQQVDSSEAVDSASTLLLSRDHYLKGNVYKLLFLYPSSARISKKGPGWIQEG